jgi:prophage regulatory protein
MKQPIIEISPKRNQKTPPQTAVAMQDKDALLKTATTVELTGLSVSTIRRKVNEGTFPAPVKLGIRCTRWKAGEVRAWLQAQGVAK